MSDYSRIAQAVEDAIIETVVGSGDHEPMQQALEAIREYVNAEVTRQVQELSRCLHSHADILELVQEQQLGKEPHAITAARQRFGWELTRTNLTEISTKARTLGAAIPGASKPERQNYLLQYRDRYIVAVLSRDTHMVITLLPAAENPR